MKISATSFYGVLDSWLASLWGSGSVIICISYSNGYDINKFYFTLVSIILFFLYGNLLLGIGYSASTPLNTISLGKISDLSCGYYKLSIIKSLVYLSILFSHVFFFLMMFLTFLIPSCYILLYFPWNDPHWRFDV